MAAASPALPVLWLYGPSGVGKTTAAWELYRTGAQSGADVALIEPELTAMLFPADAGGWNLPLITENLTGMVANLRVAGARGVVVTSVFDTRTVAEDVEKQVPGVAVTCCRLRANKEDHAHRFEA